MKNKRTNVKGKRRKCFKDNRIVCFILHSWLNMLPEEGVKSDTITVYEAKFRKVWISTDEQKGQHGCVGPKGPSV